MSLTDYLVVLVEFSMQLPSSQQSLSKILSLRTQVLDMSEAQRMPSGQVIIPLMEYILDLGAMVI